MKNKVKAIGKILGILATALMLASFSPSLDGRAVVVDRGVFPQGLFAKTVGYLPGDIISVANITGDSTVDLLVIGALDPSDGIAIMLSPEAADAVGISKDDNIVVKITKRNGQNERVYGTAVIAKQNSAGEASALELDIAEEDFDESEDDTPPAPAVEDANEIFDDDSDDEPYEEISAAQESAAQDESESEIEEFDDEEAEAFEDDFEAATADEFEPFEEEAVDEQLEDEPSADDFEEFYEEEEVPGDAFDEDSETVPENPEKIEKVVVVVVDEIPALPGQTATERVEADEFEDYEEEDVAEELVSDDEPYADEEEETEEIIAEPQSNEPKEMVIIIEESLPPAPEDAAGNQQETFEESDEWESVIPEEVWAEEESAGKSAASDITEEVPAEEPYEEDEIEEIVESPAVHEESVEDDADEVSDVIEEADYDDYEDEDYDYGDYDDEDDEYDAIVLVPVSPEPPAPVARPEPEKESTPSAPVPPAPAADESESHEMTDSGYGKYLVDSLDDLQSGAYYIQIATLTVDEHIMDIVTKYSANYPITIVPLSSGARKQVLIGPLSMDEYAVVLERFKSYGYKDAFLRKIK